MHLRSAAFLLSVGLLPLAATGGTATQKTFTSQTLGKTMTYWLYLPANYNQQIQSGNKFSVVYLLHMWLDVAGKWHSNNAPRMSPYVDRCLDSVSGIIAVAPQDDSPHASGTGTSWWVDSPVNAQWKYSTFLSTDLRNHIDATCSTYTDKGHRGVCGASMGGFGALHNLRVHNDVYGAGYAVVPCVDLYRNNSQFGLYSAFGYPYSAAVWNPFDPIKNVADFKTKNLKLGLHTGDCRSGCPSGVAADVFHAEILSFHDSLNARGLAHTFTDYADDGHEYPNQQKMVMILRFFQTAFTSTEVARPDVPRLSARGSVAVGFRPTALVRADGRSGYGRCVGLDGRTLITTPSTGVVIGAK